MVSRVNQVVLCSNILGGLTTRYYTNPKVSGKHWVSRARYCEYWLLKPDSTFWDLFQSSTPFDDTEDIPKVSPTISMLVFHILLHHVPAQVVLASFHIALSSSLTFIVKSLLLN